MLSTHEVANERARVIRGLRDALERIRGLEEEKLERALAKMIHELEQQAEPPQEENDGP